MHKRMPLSFFSFAVPLLFLLLFSGLSPTLAATVVSIKAVTTIAKTDDNFVCATMDWWPPDKCNYGMCPWGNASILNLDLNNPILVNALKAFGSLRIRIGGSLQDQVLYKVGDGAHACADFKIDKNGLFGFTEGCLPMQRWDELNKLFNSTGSIISFGLNALAGRSKSNSSGNLYEGQWDPTNARDFIKYTLSKNYTIESWELGNELSGSGVAASVEAVQYGKDMIVLKNVINDLYGQSKRHPKLLAPGGFFDKKWFADMLQTSGPGVIDAATHHIYNLGPGNDKDLIRKIQDPFYLDQVAQTFNDALITVGEFGPWSSPWIGESGGAYNSGGKNVSNAFVDGFWYLDQLGMASTYDHKVYCRQSLIGGNYCLLDTTTFVPNPDFYGALLWHQLMGPGVLHTTSDGSPYLRAYAHCSKKKSGVTLLLINLSNSTAFDVVVTSDLNLYRPRSGNEQGQHGEREEYHLTAQGGDLRSSEMLLNGKLLKLTPSFEIPHMEPSIVSAGAPLTIAPLSIAFVRFKDFQAPACAGN
ncbi:heparanase-like protein 1 [Musa acuminata AAA Group]|uniref:heparanase-like protein 1 n=1 Tax=Musa acuminata AAA Group TaxID=214697 RepID=UPI0031D130DB